jgi:hypothetical protein
MDKVVKTGYFVDIRLEPMSGIEPLTYSLRVNIRKGKK